MAQKPRKKIGILSITLNPPYWQFIGEMLWGLNTFFLKHPFIKDKYDVQYMVWSDIPESSTEVKQKVAQWLLSRNEATISMVNQNEAEIILTESQKQDIENLTANILQVRNSVKLFSTESAEWPLPTLLRYNLFLQQEEYIKDFDYLFYIDVDMKITDWIGEEILGDGLTAAQHPMYALRNNLHPPYEPNPESTAYIPRPGRIVEENGKKKFEQLYYAGGFQGGKTEDFIKAMKVMRKNIEDDFNRNYIARWNDESHWNKYLFEIPPSVVLNPSYIYPDSLISEYYVKVWGRNYSPKIMTLTKSFTTNKQDGAQIAKQLAIM